MNLFNAEENTPEENFGCGMLILIFMVLAFAGFVLLS